MVTDNKWIQVAGSGTGNWSNAAHWSLGHVPPGNTTERAVFDADSFGANGETVTVDALSSCGGMDWSAITKTGITLAVTGNILYVYGPDIVFSTLTTGPREYILMKMIFFTATAFRHYPEKAAGVILWENGKPGRLLS